MSKTATMKQGYRMILDEAVGEQAEAIRHGVYDPFDMETLFSFAPDGATLFDIGANVGFYSVAFLHEMRRRGTDGFVFAFEPVAANHARTIENLKLNGLDARAEVNRCGLGAEPGELTFRLAPGGEANNAVGENMMTPGVLADVKEWRRDTAPVVRLDDWAKERAPERCDVVKIDVEGAEPLVFEGGREFLARFRPAILGEFSPFWMKQIGWDFDRVVDFFDGFDYAIFRLMDGRAIPYSGAVAAKELEVPSYLLVPKERAGEVRKS